jgi:4-carboxymuconolactone decarboxylase
VVSISPDHTPALAAIYRADMTRLRSLTRAELAEEQAELWDSIVDSRGGGGLDLFSEQGGLVGPFNAFVHAPKIGKRLTSLGGLLRFRTSIERRLSEVAICTVGAHWHSEFEFWAHAPMAIEYGVSPDVIEALREGRPPEFARVDERVVYAVTSQLLTDRRVDDTTFAEGRVLLGETAMVELATLVGYYCLISMLLNLFDVPLPGDADPAWPESC